MAKNRRVQSLPTRRFFGRLAGVIVAAVASPVAMIRGLDECAALRFRTFKIPDDRRQFWRHRDALSLRVLAKQRNPLFFSSQWEKRLKELPTR